MTLGEKQRLFAKLVARLITWAYEQGYAVTFGDAYRDPRVFGLHGEQKGYGKARSNHKRRLAIDLNLFVEQGHGNWVYQTSSVAHKPLGEYWEKLHPMCQWGGRFNDGNHYSMTHEGMS